MMCPTASVSHTQAAPHQRSPTGGDVTLQHPASQWESSLYCDRISPLSPGRLLRFSSALNCLHHRCIHWCETERFINEIDSRNGNEERVFERVSRERHHLDGWNCDRDAVVLMEKKWIVIMDDEDEWDVYLGFFGTERLFSDGVCRYVGLATAVQASLVID